MNSFLEKTDGAFVETKESSIVFDYADAEKMFGSMIAKELAKNIESSVGIHYPLNLVFGHTYLEIKPASLKKVMLKYNNLAVIFNRENYRGS